MTYPFSPLVALVLAGAILILARRRWLRWLGIAAFLVGWLGSTPLVSNVLIGSIESRADAKAEECDDLDAVVLLSGGLLREPRDAHDMQALNAETQQRVMAFVERDRPEVPLILSGGGWFDIGEAELMRDLLRRVAPQREVAMIESESRNTWENAVFTARLAPPPRRLAVATSALHMPRARRAFETMGYTVCPWPLNRVHVNARGWWVLLPHSTAVRKTELFVHELGGWLVYGWRATPDLGVASSEE
jgi:uncharacterized SAM-binding protein YcdF (DUF218 family)